MRKIVFHDNVRFMAEKDMANRRKLHYYICLPGGRKLYAFTRKFSLICYEVCKSAPGINDIICRRMKNVEFMRLVKYLNYMMPYLADCYELGYRKTGRGRNVVA